MKVMESYSYDTFSSALCRDGTSIVLSDDVGQIYFLNTGQGESQKNAKYDQVWPDFTSQMHDHFLINGCSFW